MGLEEGKTPLRPVLLLEKGSSSCTVKLITCQSGNDAKEILQVGLLWGESL